MKASLALTLLQWARQKPHIQLLLRAALAIDCIICLIVVEYLLVQCAPISYAWHLTDSAATGTCLPASQQIIVGQALAGTTILLDMVFLIVPFFLMRGRGVSRRARMYVYGIFGLGVACVSPPCVLSRGWMAS
jgi:hypothetical protein